MVFLRDVFCLLDVFKFLRGIPRARVDFSDGCHSSCPALSDARFHISAFPVRARRREKRKACDRRIREPFCLNNNFHLRRSRVRPQRSARSPCWAVFSFFLAAAVFITLSPASSEAAQRHRATRESLFPLPDTFWSTAAPLIRPSSR